MATRSPAPGQPTGRALGRQVPRALHLWILVALELITIAIFRHVFRSAHGG